MGLINKKPQQHVCSVQKKFWIKQQLDYNKFIVE